MLVVVLSILAVACVGAQNRRFPDGFLLGAATSSYQIEGGWNASGKGESSWDYFTHHLPLIIKDKSNGDISADTYHNYRRDVEMMRELGLDAYRFSISWSRILPDGKSRVNEEGVAFYNSYIDEMLTYGIQPIVTLYHWDLPKKLLDLGGFLSTEFPEWFESYARVVFSRYGDRVKMWITFNEPGNVCFPGHSFKVKLNSSGTFTCAKNLVLANARAYRLYHNEFEYQGGQCGITINVQGFEPLRDTAKDKYAAEIIRQLQWGLYADPIFSKEGGFPKDLSELIAKKSIKLGYSKSLLPTFTDEEKSYVRGTADFFGVNHYTAKFVSAVEHKYMSFLDDVSFEIYVPDEWPRAASNWLYLAPNSLSNTLVHLHKKYNDTVFFITENGWSTPPGSLEDDDRIRYLRAAMDSVLDSLEAGVDVRGYMVWSLMDNFEWVKGYTERFGLYEVDFESTERIRTPRKSAFVYKEMLRSRRVDHDYEPDSRVMWIEEGH